MNPGENTQIVDIVLELVLKLADLADEVESLKRECEKLRLLILTQAASKETTPRGLSHFSTT